MPLQIIDYSKIAPQGSPYANLFEDALKGYKMAKEPENMKREATAKELANNLKGLELEHKPKEYELNDKQKELANSLQSKALEHYEEKFGLERDLKKAQIQKALREPSTQAKLSGIIGNYKASHPNASPEDLQKFSDRVLAAQIKNLEAGKGGTAIKPHGKIGNIAFANEELKKPDLDPEYRKALEKVLKDEEKKNVQTEIKLPDGSKGYVNADENTKKDWQPVKNSDDKIIGWNVPMDSKMTEQWKGTQKFNVVQPFLNDSLSYYSGSDSWERYVNDAAHYKTNKEARDRIDNFNAAEKLLTVGALTENARFYGHNTNVQLSALKKTLEASEVHQKLKSGATVALPPGYAREAGKIYKVYLDKFEDVEKKNIPSHQFQALNPEKNNYKIEAPVTPTDVQTLEQYKSWFDGLTTAQKEAIAAKSKANNSGGQ